MPFQSTGQAVSNSLQEILTSRKAEQRQALLDSLNQKNVESEISYRNENAKSMAAEREALAKYRQAESQAIGLKSITDNPPEIGDPLSPDQEKFVPDSMKRITGGMTLPSRNLTAAVTAPSLHGDSGASAGEIVSDTPSQKSSIPAQTRWAGTDEQRHDQQVQANLPDLLSYLNSNPSASTTEKMLRTMQAFKERPTSASVISSFKPTTHPILTQGRDGLVRDGSGKVVSESPDGAVIRTVPAPVQGPELKYFTHVNPKGEIEVKWIRPGEAVPPGYREGNPPAGGLHKGPIFPATMQGNLDKLRAKAASNKAADLEANKAATMGALSYAEANGVDPTIVASIRQYLLTNDKRSNDQLIEVTALDPDTSREELADFTRLLYAVRKP